MGSQSKDVRKPQAGMSLFGSAKVENKPPATSSTFTANVFSAPRKEEKKKEDEFEVPDMGALSMTKQKSQISPGLSK